MARSPVIAIKILSDSAQARKDLDQVGGKVTDTGSKLSKLAKPAAVVVAGIGAVSKAFIDSASELQQSTGATQSIFGKYANSIITNAKKAAGAVGLSQSAYQNVAVLLGSQLKNLGTPMDQVAGKTTDLITKASDLAATFGGTTADAVEAIGSLFRGESDPIERYGVSINQAAIQAYALAHKLPMATAAQQKQAKATAIMALLYQQTSSAAGQFARETNTAAGASEIASAKYENAKAALGQKLLPVYAKFKNALAGAADFVQRNSHAVFTLVGVIGGLAAAVLLANGALKVYRGIQEISAVLAGRQAAATGLQSLALGAQKVALGISTAAQWAFNAAMNANPVMLVVTAIGLLVGAFVLAYNKSQTFRDIVAGAFDAVMRVVGPFVSFFTDTIPHAFGVVVTSLHEVWDKVRGFIAKWGPAALVVLAPFIGIPLIIYRNFGKIVGFLKDVWSRTAGGVSSFVGKVVDYVGSIPGKLLGLVGKIGNAAGHLVSALWDGLKNLGGNAKDFVGGLIGDIADGLKHALNTVLHLPWKLPRIKIGAFGHYVHIGGQTIFPALASVPEPPNTYRGPESLAGLMPGFTLFAASLGAGWSAGLSPASPSLDGSLTAVQVRVEFNGLVTDPDGVAASINELLTGYRRRRGLVGA